MTAAGKAAVSFRNVSAITTENPPFFIAIIMVALIISGDRTDILFKILSNRKLIPNMIKNSIRDMRKTTEGDPKISSRFIPMAGMIIKNKAQLITFPLLLTTQG